MNKSLQVLAISLLIASCTSSEEKNSGLILDLMKSHPEKFQDILENTEKYEIQIIYTQIDRDQNNVPKFTTLTYNFDSLRYFYPASTVKLPMVLLAFEKLHRINIAGLDKFTPMLSDSVYGGQLSVKEDTTSENNLPTIEHYARKILVVSDNDAYNRLYEFMGQKEVNKRLHELGYQSIRILNRLERPLSQDENRHTEAVRFMKGGKIVFSQPMLINDTPIVVNTPVLKGKGFFRNDSLINSPFVFTYKNFYPLHYQQSLLRSLIFPSSVKTSMRFKISEDDRAFVLKYMSQLPTETIRPAYAADTAYYDDYCKFLMFGSSHSTIPDHIRIFNKVGDAYGFLIDNAYVVDFQNKVEFMLSAVINTNTDEIYNDSEYQYETLGFPFMKNLGQLIYNYELNRKKERLPDLSEFKLTYDKVKSK
jgi:hypothetical protein